MLSALLRRNIVEPLYALKNASPKLRYWRELEKTQYLAKNVLRQIQWDRLSQLLQYVYANNRFYRKRFDDMGLKPSDIKAPEDIKKIPVLTKKEIRRNINIMISDGFKIEELLRFKTGGSTGKPLEVYITEDCSEMRNACARRHDRWSGWEVGEPVGAVWGNPVLPKGVKARLRNWLLTPVIYLDTMCVNEESVREFADQWQKIKPTLLFGHAHSLFVLAQFINHLGITSIKPKGIISSSMMLLPHERKKIEQVFDVKVFDRYGCEEVSLIASECEKHDGVHLNIEHLYIEFIAEDGEYAKPGEPGKIIVTDLLNRAMPFIRYQIEDVGSPSERKCSCGRGLPLIKGVTGRVADFLIREDGSKVAGVSLIENTMARIPGIEQMQIIQENLNCFVLNVVAGREFNRVREEQLKNYFKNLFNRQCRVEVNRVQEIPAESSGKFRFSICRVPS